MDMDETKTWNHPPDRTKTYTKRMDDMPRHKTMAPPQRHASVIWIVAHFVYYRLQNNRRLSLRDYIDFVKRARWKQIEQTGRTNTGRYLEVLEWNYP